MLRVSQATALHIRNRIRVANARAGAQHVLRVRQMLPAVAHFSHSSSPGSSPETPNPNNSTEKKSLLVTVTSSIKSAAHSIADMVSNPKETWKMIKEVADHYWLGSKLLWSDIKVARALLGRVLEGHSMTRRERLQLIRTTTDIFRLVPFSIFIIVPFMELLLPFALKLFPNMLPSTFQDSLKAEESMKQELQMRLAVAKFMQETLQQMAEKKQASAPGADKDAASGAKEVIEFVEKARQGAFIPNEQVMRIAKLFKDELTLANVTRPQLVGMCQYMGLQPYGGDSFLRFQLRAKLRALQDDDRRILWEGIDSLNTIELRDACRERGMRSIGMTQFRLKKQLQEWLELSTQKGIPIFLLIMSRAFMLNSSGEAEAGAPGAARKGLEVQPSDPEQVLRSSMSFLDADTINEVVLEAASRGEVDTADMRRRRLESIQFQQELMEEERQEQEGASKTRNLPQAGAKAPPAAPAADKSHAHTRTALVGKDRIEEVVGDRAAVAAADAQARASSSVSPEPPVAPVSAPAAAGKLATQVQPRAIVEIADKEDLQMLADAEGESAAAAKPELTIHELVTLSDLARGNSLRREMSELAVLEAFIESLPLDSAAAARKQAASVPVPGTAPDGWVEDAADGAAGASGKAEDKSVKMMQSAISSMVSKLKVKINTTEKVLGDKLKVLDRDGDGQISLDEIKDVVTTVMRKGAATEEHVAQLFEALDSNKDGKVSLTELLQYIHKKKESRELENLEAQRKAAEAAAAAAASAQELPTSGAPVAAPTGAAETEKGAPAADPTKSH